MRKYFVMFSTAVLFLTGTSQASAAKEEVEKCVKNDYSDWEYKTVSGPHYDSLTFKYTGGTVYDRDLKESDFESTQREYYKEQKRYVKDIRYYTWADTAKIDYVCDKEDVYEANAWSKSYEADITKNKKANVTVKVKNDKKTSSGIVDFIATAITSRGEQKKTIYKSSYFVKDVKITVPEKDYQYDEVKSIPVPDCEIVYGNGTTKNCGSGDKDDSQSDNKVDSVKGKYLSEMKSKMVSSGLNSYWATVVDNGPQTPFGQYDGYRLNQSDLDNGKNLWPSDSTPTIENKSSGGMTLQIHKYNFGDLYIYSYYDEHSKRFDTEYVKRWQLAAVDIEDETRNPKKTVYAQNSSWNKQPWEKTEWEDVTCKVYYFGQDYERDCKESEKEIDTNESSIGYGPHRTGEETLEYYVSGGNGEFGYVEEGDRYRFIRYFAEVIFDDINPASDEDFRTIIYADKVDVSDQSQGRDGTYEDVMNYDYVPHVTVEETHNRGIKTPKNYSTYEGYTWKSYVEQYTNFDLPSCEVTYAPTLEGKLFPIADSSLDGDIRTKDCTKDMYHLYALTYSDGSVYTAPGKKVFSHDYGYSWREASYGYVENGFETHKYYIFHYATDVELEFTDSGSNEIESYQDEPYPNLTCTKTYPAIDGGYFQFGEFEKSCLDRTFITKDTGQNDKMGQERVVDFKYVNNDYFDVATLTRTYANSVDIYSNKYPAPKSSGITGTSQFYECKVNWQDYTNKDISLLNKVWKSTTGGSEINFIGENWNGYTDVKGNFHGPSAINNFYIVDPVTNDSDHTRDYKIHCDYPWHSYNNGLTPGWSYVGDYKASKHDEKNFRLYGIEKAVVQDTTTYDHEIDVNNPNGLFAVPSSSSGSRTSVPEAYVFPSKTYQTGHFYDFKAYIFYANGTVEEIDDATTSPEFTWRYKNGSGSWVTSGGYKVGGVNTQMPTSSLDHRLPLEEWNAIRFDYFSEGGIPKPGGQVNNVSGQTYEEVSLWAHSPLELVIEGPRRTALGVQNDYRSYLVWSDGSAPNQGGDRTLGVNNSPWSSGHSNPIEVTNSLYTGWSASEIGEIATPSSGPAKFTFNDYQGNNTYRTVSTWWGDESRTIAGFQYWDYFYQEIDVMIDDVASACGGINTPKHNCALPIDDGYSSNYRLPQNGDVVKDRNIRVELPFWVTGVSKGN